MNQTLKKWTVPAALLVLTLLSFGLMIPNLGFYWDDWPSLLIFKIQGLDGFRQFFELDRPTTYLSYNLLMPLLGTEPLRWQIFTLCLRWITAIFTWWFVRRMWPEAEEIAILSGLFFSVYPVFRQQSIALTYHQLWLEYIFYLLSLAGMVEALRNRRKYWVWTITAVLGLVLNFLISEYFLGIELVRPLILWLALSSIHPEQASRQRLKSTLLHWAPYLVTFAGYLAWRFIFMDLPGPDRNAPEMLSNLLSTPLPALLQLAQMAAQDFLYIAVTSWYATLQPTLLDFSNRFNLFSLGAGLGAAFLCGAYLLWTGRRKKENMPFCPDSSKTILLLGIILIAIGPLPAWATNRQVIVGAWSDRLAVPAMFGASMALAGLITWLVRKRVQGIVIASLLICLAVGYNLRVANDYRWARIQQNRFYWQISWRAPQITPGTALFAEAEILPKTGLYSTAAGINVIYAQPDPSENLPYWFFSLTREFGHQIPELVSGLPLQTSFRQFTFKGRSQDSLIVYFDPKNADCMRVLTQDDRSDPGLPPVTRQSLAISNLARIRAGVDGENIPPADIFGPEPEQGWCYTFQKADLARQLGNWEEVANLGDQAQAAGFSLANSQSNTPQEWIPFIEGYARTERWQEALEISRQAFAAEPKMGPRLCDTWQVLQEAFPEIGQQQGVQDMLAEGNCSPQ